MVKNVWVLTSPDNEHYDEDFAQEAIESAASRADVTATATGRTRDAGHGQETEYEVGGAEQDIKFFESCLKDALY